MVLPGTGSDAAFAEAAFGPGLRDRGVSVVAVEPDPRGIVASYHAALDAAAADGPIAVGGISIGAAVALDWARHNPARAAFVLAALPPWTGASNGAPAAHSARYTATSLRADGLDAVIAAMRATSPQWLGDVLERSWRAQWPDLPTALEEAATYVAPTAAELATITAPVGIVAATDDAVHPLHVGWEWAAALPHAGFGTTTLAAFGPAPRVLGTVALRALPRY